MWGSEHSQQSEDFFCIIVLQFVGHPPERYVIWFYQACTPPTISLWLLLCLWMWSIFLWWVSASSLVLQLVVAILVLSQEMNTHPSTPASWTGSLLSMSFYFLPYFCIFILFISLWVLLFLPLLTLVHHYFSVLADICLWTYWMILSQRLSRCIH